MTSLHELSADKILEVVAERSGILERAEMTAGMLEANFKAYEASSAALLRDDGKSMAEATARVKGTENWLELFFELQAAHVEAAAAKRDYQRAILASDMWRTEKANRRVV